MKKLIVSISALYLLIIIVSTPRNLLGQTSHVDNTSSANVLTSPPTDQIIVKFNNNGSEKGLLTTNINQQLPALSDAVGAELNYVRPMSGEAHVLKLSGRLPIAEVAQIAADLSALPEVAYAEPDRIYTIGTDPTEKVLAPTVTPNDTRWSDMWHLRYTANSDEGINMVPAWDIAIGLSTTIVAVIDTGILNHSDLAGKTVPGYDFIGDTNFSNDGNGRDSDPSDPGDWVAANQCNGTHNALDSSWHGTHVAGTIGAASNNNLGITGINWNAKILPVRVLGQCGGYNSDIVDGMRWAAGLAVAGVPNNANPADVLNLSLGSTEPSSCGSTYQNAIDEIVAAGATIVIAAGNLNANSANYSPGNCNNVITVAATDRGGDRASYSNYGSVIEVSAPGGEGIGANGVLSTLDSGTTTPNNDNSYAFYPGTSMATPHVAGLASLIKSVKPDYTQAQVLSLLQSTARDFPAGSGCNTSICGSGIIDAYQALSFFNIIFTDFVYLPIVVKPEPVILLTNAGFESGVAGWTEFSSHGWTVITNNFPEGVPPHSGSWGAWLGGDHDDISYIQQEVTIQSATPYLTYWHGIISDDSCGADFAGVLVDGGVVHQYNLCTSTNTGRWVQHSVNLSAYAGQTVTVQIRVETNSNNYSNLFVDDVSFQAGPVENVTSLSTDEIGDTIISKEQFQP